MAGGSQERGQNFIGQFLKMVNTPVKKPSHLKHRTIELIHRRKQELILNEILDCKIGRSDSTLPRNILY